jgi:MFS family permease
MSSPASILGFRDVLKNPSVKRLWIARIVRIFGDFLAIFAVFSVVTFQLNGTPTQVSMILAAYLAPLAIISPLAGVFGALLSVYVRDVLQIQRRALRHAEFTDRLRVPPYLSRHSSACSGAP